MGSTFLRSEFFRSLLFRTWHADCVRSDFDAAKAKSTSDGTFDMELLGALAPKKHSLDEERLADYTFAITYSKMQQGARVKWILEQDISYPRGWAGLLFIEGCVERQLV